MSRAQLASAESQPERERGTGNVYLRGRIWWCFYPFRGKTKRESSKSAHREDAIKLLNRRNREVGNDKEGLRAFIPNAHKVYVDELLDALEKEYRRKGGRALAAFRSHLKPVRKAFGDLRAVAVTATLINKYVDHRQSGTRPRSGSTVNRELQLLGQAFKLGIEQQHIVTAPRIPHLPEGSPRSGFFEHADFQALVTNLPKYLRDFTRFGFITGWRKSQIAKLQWSHVDRDAGVFIAPGEIVKNGSPHKLVIAGDLVEIFERAWAEREYKTRDGLSGVSAYVFHQGGRPVGDFRKSWATACEAAGILKPKLDKNGDPIMATIDGKKQPVMIPAKIFHDLRRTGVRNLVRGGVREGVAMAISGHRTRSIFDRYNISDETDIRAAIVQTSEHVKAQRTIRKVAQFRTGN